MATVDVVNAAFLVGNLAITSINRKLAEERTAKAWYGDHVEVFTSKKTGSGRRLKATLVVRAHERREVVLALLRNSSAWLKRKPKLTETCWLPLYEALKSSFPTELEVPVSDAGETVALLSQKPTASVDCWALVTTNYAMGGTIRFDEDAGGRQLCTMNGPRFTLTAWRTAFTEPWQGHIDISQGNTPFPPSGLAGWENLLQNGSTLLDKPVTQLYDMALDPRQAGEEQIKLEELHRSIGLDRTHLVSQEIFERILKQWLVILNKCIEHAVPPNIHDPAMIDFDLYNAWRQWYSGAITCREKVSSLSGRTGSIYDWAFESAVTDLNSRGRNALKDAFPVDRARDWITVSICSIVIFFQQVNQVYVIGTRFMAFGDSPSFNLAGGFSAL